MTSYHLRRSSGILPNHAGIITVVLPGKWRNLDMTGPSFYHEIGPYRGPRLRTWQDRTPTFTKRAVLLPLLYVYMVLLEHPR